MFTAATPVRLAAVAGREPVRVPPRAVPAGASVITPEMVPLAGLSAGELAAVVAQVPGGAANVTDVYRLGPLQEGLFFHHRLQAGQERDPYLLRQVFRFDSRARLEAFLRAWQQVMDRHEVLRTSIAWEGLSHPVQVVHRRVVLPVSWISVTTQGAVGSGGVVEELLERCGAPMDLRRAPLVDGYVAAEPGTGRWLLVWRMHHITQDHTTLDVVLDEVAAVLEGRAEQLPEPLPYREYVGQALLGMPAAEHEAYFAGLLEEVSEPTAPFGVLRVRGDGRDVTDGHAVLDGELAARVRERARQAGVSPATVFHVVWTRVLATLAGRDDVVFGTLLFGRMQAGTGGDRVPGLFINTLPVRAGIREVGVGRALRLMQTQLADLMVHEHASLATAQQASGVHPPTPLFTAILNYRHHT
ncbi:condensation domain-containing protein, partial [Streptomyces sp. 5-6(2022)]|uniref:condensation domain-containing protein n=1 Tax=Streptomyces sp. 5-6(2022) TaxID=2936510 RepID=UPI0023B8F641